MAIVLVLVVLVAIGGGAAFFFKSKANSAADENARPSDAPTPRPAPVADTPPARLTTPQPQLDDLLSAKSSASAAAIDAPPPVATPSVSPVPPAEPVAAEPVPAEPLTEEDAGFDRFGSPGARLKKPTANEPLAPLGRVYDMELDADGVPIDPAAVVADTSLTPPAADPESTIEPEPTIEPAPVAEVAPEAEEAVGLETTEPEPVVASSPVVEPEPAPVAVAEEGPSAGADDEQFAYASLVEPTPPEVEPEPEPQPVSAAVEVPEPAPVPDVEAGLAPVAAAGDNGAGEPTGAIPPRDAVDHVLQALISRAQERKVALAQVAAELVEQANLEDREIDEVLGDLIAVAPEERENVDPNERLEELTMFNDAVPKRPGQINAFDQLGSSEKKRVIIRVLCLLVALQEDYKLQPAEPASEAETRSWPLARAVWPVKAQSDDDDENKPIQRRKTKGKLAKSR